LAEAPYAFGSQLADWQGVGDSEKRWRARLSIPDSYNIVAVLDGQPVGMASGVPTDDATVAELISMWVSPAARGRGVGDQLITSVVEWARGAGAREVRLSVAEGNDSATALYRRKGFRDTGESAGLMPDGIRTEWAMALSLSTTPS
jgi:ribosomal protein S18 acetylase RimI-like enzyme